TGAASKAIDLPELFVCGTTSRSAKEFLAAARRNRTPVFSLPRQLARGGKFKRSDIEALASQAVAALGARRRGILTIGLPPVRKRSAARRLSVHLVRVAAAILRQARVGHV